PPRPLPCMSAQHSTTATQHRHHPRHPAPPLVRNVECGMRSVSARFVPRHDFTLQFRIPHSALRICHSPAPVSYLRSMTREARRLAARSYLRFSSAVSGTIGGTVVGVPLSSSATYVT